MTDFPIQLQLKGRLCIVVGGGAVGRRKINGLLAAGARVRLITAEPTADLPAEVELVQRPLPNAAISPAPCSPLPPPTIRG